MTRLLTVLALLAVSVGCGLLPEVVHQPIIQNPFPQLQRVAIAPFMNHSDEPTVDGRRFALAYFNELQALPGFEVVPLGVVERAIEAHQLRFDTPDDARRLAQILEVDAVVVGAVTEFSPYYPPRCGLHVEWWAANPCFHSIPPGYGLPWGTPEEEFIPEELRFEAEMALARAQMETQTPKYEPQEPVPNDTLPPPPTEPALLPTPASPGRAASPGRVLAHQESITPIDKVAANVPATITHPKPEGWPDPNGFVPPGPSPLRATCNESNEPVLRHTRIYHGNEPQFTEALANYEYFRDDARYGGWQSYLQRSDDFIRFCCHLHIAEMLSARGGAGKTRVVLRWSPDR